VDGLVLGSSEPILGRNKQLWISRFEFEPCRTEHWCRAKGSPPLGNHCYLRSTTVTTPWSRMARRWPSGLIARLEFKW